MIKRILVVENGTYLHREHCQLVLERDRQRIGQVPFEDLGVLVLDHPAIVLTQSVLVACQEAGAAVIISDERHLPAGLLLPLNGHTLHARILDAQIHLGEGLKNRLWRVLIQAKIAAQASTLEKQAPEIAAYLRALINRVRSGDPENLEAQAAKIYWPALFGDEFRRGDDSHQVNSALNYGYALLRAALARAIVGSGLHPALGIHHHNQYDHYRLADDLMEPLRPWVDGQVRAIAPAEIGSFPPLDPPLKRVLLRLLEGELTLGKRRLPLFAALSGYTASLAGVACGQNKLLKIPTP